ncbi:allophanate hydrolase [Saccharospirillum sp. MSK14-1]|uniref:allophanate hydrolase n=1 Tax=Saccharospirillum sp. MSK14-1 TaxID=1897632 RepID=UPI000D3BC226|nr:allophanate hydrolase [Saccharospirillum sp. MSK14-1]PTY37645.1 allophanate hydrolase [Saccharospirillum sp. MSK14-1]
MTLDTRIESLSAAYRSGDWTPESVLAQIRQQATHYADHNIWLYQLSDAELQPYFDALAKKDPASTPLWGIPFAIKDNIDLAGVPTTAGCEAFAYTPTESAVVVQRLIAAGAIPVGKTNLDQFATGLNGTRSPHGACANAFDADYISGGSSSGSAVAVALGMASFSLGTDTAGSGRVPAAFNNLVGLKPSIGLLPTTGVVSACRSLDCVSIFALNCSDANAVLACAEGLDEADPYSRSNRYDNSARHYGVRQGRLRLGRLRAADLKFFGDDDFAAAYQQSLVALDNLDIDWVEIDYAPFDEAARLLYEGPWVSERYLAIQPMMEQQPDQVFSVVRDIIAGGRDPKATDLFRAQYRLNALKRTCWAQLEGLDALLTPTAGRHFTIAELLEEPVRYNSELGYYTNFMNLIDWAAVAVPTAFTEAGRPFGITLSAPAFRDRSLLSIAHRLQQSLALPQGALQWPPLPASQTAVAARDHIRVAVCGAHLEGLPLNFQLAERGAKLQEKTQTSANYRFYALAGGPPFRPGLVRDELAGVAIEVEVWSVPSDAFGSFVADIPAPLGIGKLELADGRWVSGFICEAAGLSGATDISQYGSWKAYLAAV